MTSPRSSLASRGGPGTRRWGPRSVIGLKSCPQAPSLVGDTMWRAEYRGRNAAVGVSVDGFEVFINLRTLATQLSFLNVSFLFCKIWMVHSANVY